jgi:hypothetical protein
MEKQFLEWAHEPANRDQICGVQMTVEKRRRAIAEIYGRVPPEPVADAETEPEGPAASAAKPLDEAEEDHSTRTPK